MFGNKRKIDSKIRFQNSRFKHRLSEARGYKRPLRNRPVSKGEFFLSKIGLGSWFSRFATLLVFLLLIYLVFVPNVFFVKQTMVNISQGDDKSTVENLVNSYLSKKLPWPQKNLILLSKAGLKEFLLKNDQKILAVNSISKKFPSTLILNISPRLDEFAVETASGTDFSIANDGLTTGEIYPDASGTLPSALTSVKLDNSDGLIIGHQAFSQNQINFLNLVQNQLPEIAKSSVDYFELAGLQIPDLTVYFKSGFKIILGLNSDSTQTLSRLKLLFSQLASTDIGKLYYIDMRFGDSGYVCYKGTPCVQNINLPSSIASTTPVAP
jgi:hypothetical protein